MKFQIEKTTFPIVETLWQEKLWKNRVSKIEPTSTMLYQGGYDMELKQAQVSFFCATLDHKIIGVISGFPTCPESYRLRGLYVDEEYRRIGVATSLFQACEDDAKNKNYSFLWSFPRRPAIDVYLSFGFKSSSDWINEGVEFGPNKYVRKDLINPDVL